MLRRTIPVLVAALTLLPAAAFADPAELHGRSVRTQAGMDAVLVGDDTGRVQVLASLCDRPWSERRCTPMSARLRAALEDALPLAITWVSRRDVRGPQFLVFAPVRFDAGVATARYGWWDRGRDTCRGGTSLHFSRQRGVWRVASGEGWALCPARPAR